MTWHYVTEDDPEGDVSDVESNPKVAELIREFDAGPRLGKDDDPGRPPFPKLPKPGQAFAVFVPTHMAAAVVKKQAEETEAEQAGEDV